MTLTKLEKKLIAALSAGLPLVERPYQLLAERLGVSEEEVRKTISRLIEKKIIRRFGGTIRHDLAGVRGNVMVAWLVPPDRIEEVGELCAQKPFITHCYVRKTAPDWPYNFYTMLHAPDEKECRKLVEELARELGLTDYELLFTEKEIMRRMRRYFEDEI